MNTWKKIALFLTLSVSLSITPFRAAHATVEDTTAFTSSALGNGVLTNYTIGFDFRDNSEVIVYLQEESVTPFTQTQVLQGAGATKFTIIGVPTPDPGTTVVMGTAPTTTQRLIIKRLVPLTQKVNYNETEAFPAADHEQQMDEFTFALQQIDLKISEQITSQAAFTTLNAFGSTPNSSAATLVGNSLTFQPASVSFPGGVSTTTQTFAGSKTIDGTSNQLTLENSTGLVERIVTSANSSGVVFNAVDTNGTAVKYIWKLAGTEKMRLDVNGFLGVNNANPSSPLSLTSGTTTAAFFRNSAANDSQIAVGNTVSDLSLRVLASGDAFIFADSGKYLSFGSNGSTEKARLDVDGTFSLQNSIATARQDIASAASIQSLSNTTSIVRLTGSTATTLSGILAGIDGQRLTLFNNTGQNLTLVHDATASAANRIITMTGANVVTTANGAAEFYYDTGLARWIAVYVTP